MALKHHNHGFTLVELVVVVAILGILAGTLTLSISSVSSGRAKKAAQMIDDMLSQCKVLTLSGADDPHITITLSSDVYYASLYLGSTLREQKKLGGAELQIGYYEEGEDKTVADDGDLTLSFIRTTGALNGSCTAIITGSYTVSITPSTGYHKVGRI